MEVLTPSEHKIRLINLATLWQKARQDCANLIGEAEARARALEQEAAAAFTDAKQAAENAFLQVRHDISTGLVRVFDLVEVEPPQDSSAPKTVQP